MIEKIKIEEKRRGDKDQAEHTWIFRMLRDR